VTLPCPDPFHQSETDIGWRAYVWTYTFRAEERRADDAVVRRDGCNLALLRPPSRRSKTITKRAPATDAQIVLGIPFDLALVLEERAVMVAAATDLLD
jgi:hypothetical protein